MVMVLAFEGHACSAEVHNASPHPLRTLGAGRQHQQLFTRSSSVRARAATPVTFKPAPTPPTPGAITREYNGTSVREEEFAKELAVHESQPIEKSMWISEDQITGTIPKDLKGTLLRNRPGNYDFGEGERITHPFDGDGLVSAFTFDEGRVLFRRKFVRTRAMHEEMSAGKLLYKGAFTVGDPSGKWQLPSDISVRQPANTAIVDWAGRLLALYERDLPYELDDSLRTLGKSTLDGVWQEGDYMGAHYRIVTEADGSQRMVTFYATEQRLAAKVKVVELDEDGRKVHEMTLVLPDASFGFLHDILVTDNYYVFIENPTRMDYWKLLTKYVPGMACIAECLYVDAKRPMKIHCIPRPGKAGTPRPVYEAPSMFSFHHVNAYEVEGSDAIVVDTLARDSINFAGTDLQRRSVEEFHAPETLTAMRRLVCRGQARKAQCSFVGRDAPALGRQTDLPSQLPPAFTGKPHSCFYVLASRSVPKGEIGIGQCIGKYQVSPGAFIDEASLQEDLQSASASFYYAGDGRSCEEPTFVPRQGAAADEEDDGYLLFMVRDVRSHDPGEWFNTLEILDARHLEAGPVASIAFKDLTPPGLHGSWSPRLLQQMEGEAVPFTNDVRRGLSQP